VHSLSGAPIAAAAVRVLNAVDEHTEPTLRIFGARFRRG
jgi:dihydroorotate dehydrogenase